VGASVVTGCNAPPILDPAEHVLDLVALPVELLVVGILDLAIGLGRDAGGNTLAVERGAQPVTVIALVTEQHLDTWQAGEQQNCAFVVAHLAFGEEQDDGTPLAIADGMELRVQPTFGAPDTSGNSPPFNRLAAVRCAFRCVASIMIASGSPALPASSAKMRLNTPRRLQRMNRL